MKTRLRMLMLCSSAALAAVATLPAVHAQQRESDSAAQGDEVSLDEVKVTATRLTASGFSAPTPTTVIGADDLALAANPNVFTTITQIPSLMGSTGIAVANNDTSGGRNGLSAFSMRGLGTIRTLTLLDGQRVGGAFVAGTTDINQFPQLLIERVDIVTGGASASYGSDAIGGVVNFVTNRRFEGVKVNVVGGQTTYDDGRNITAQVAGGVSLFGGRGHFTGSLEYNKEDMIGPEGFGVGPGPNGRNYYFAPQFVRRSASQIVPGGPQINTILNGQHIQYALYGLITAGPLQGTAFGANGTPYQFQYGSGGVPSRTAGGAVIGCISPFCVGGDNSSAPGNGTSLTSEIDRRIAFGAFSYDLTENTELFATVTIGRVDSANVPNPGARFNANLTIRCENPYVPAATRAACAANNITSFQFGTYNAQFPAFITVRPEREVVRVVVGAKGSFDALGDTWTWDTYYQRSDNDSLIQISDMILRRRYTEAIDAVVGPNGQPQCRSAVARAAGCVPMNVLGNIPPSPESWRYVTNGVGPSQDSRQSQDAFALTLNGTPFALAAGPVAVAAGLEYRKEKYRVMGDPYGNGFTATNTATSDYPADPILNANSNWFAGNFFDGAGSYDVKEAFVEFGIPVLSSESAGAIDFNAAWRTTEYSTAGSVDAWKLGLTYDTPIDGLRFRTVRSRDIRAPNLSELFPAPIVSNSTVVTPAGQLTILSRVIGNTELTPELATNTEFGLVWQPSYVPGLRTSIDYYKIKIDDAIASLTAQQIVDQCLAFNDQTCQAVFLTGNAANPNFVNVQPFNVASISTEGFDIELAYGFGMEGLGLPGQLTLRALATHVRDFTTNVGTPNSFPIQSAGVNAGSIPNWKFLMTQNWAVGKWNLSLAQRWFSDGVYNAEYIECQTTCPAPTLARPTIDNNQMKGAFYLDAGVAYDVTDQISIYAKMDNVTDTDPEPNPSLAPNNPGVNPLLYDTVGRRWRLGVRATF
jgi:iron complex outermembrane receptor protein